MPTQKTGNVVELLKRLAAKRRRTQEDLQQLDAQVEAVKITLELLRNSNRLPKAETLKSPSRLLIGKLSGKTQKQALIELAKSHHGTVKVLYAVKTLTTAGLLKPGRYAWGQLYTLMTRSQEFEKSGRGQFKLKAPPEPKNGSRVNHVIRGEDHPSKAVEAAEPQRFPRLVRSSAL